MNSNSDYVRKIAHERFNRVEKIVWFLVSIPFLLPVIRDAINYNLRVDEAFIFNANFSFLFVTIIAFPAFFQLIFGELPIESLRTKLSFKKGRKFENPPVSAGDNTYSIALGKDLTPSEMAKLTPIEMLSYFSIGSRDLSKSIFSRAGVYLIVGVFVAFSGLAFFYSQTTSTFDGLVLDSAIYLIPKIGILIFIETIAFFFLRQYRAAMDEFRYYEAIKRNREETLALFSIASEGGKEIDVIELAKALPFYSTFTPLQKDQTTEILEGRKLEKNELEVLQNIINVISEKRS